MSTTLLMLLKGLSCLVDNSLLSSVRTQTKSVPQAMEVIFAPEELMELISGRLPTPVSLPSKSLHTRKSLPAENTVTARSSSALPSVDSTFPLAVSA